VNADGPGRGISGAGASRVGHATYATATPQLRLHSTHISAETIMDCGGRNSGMAHSNGDLMQIAILRILK
jgi:hypothetical protein